MFRCRRAQADIAAGQDPHLLVNNIRNVFNDTQEFARIDHALGTKVNLFYRYLHDSLPDTQGSGSSPAAHARSFDHFGQRARNTAHGPRDDCGAPDSVIDMGYAYSSGAHHRALRSGQSQVRRSTGYSALASVCQHAWGCADACVSGATSPA